MAYSGKYKVKNPKKYDGDHLNVIYRSSWERYVCRHCDLDEHIVKWSSEEVVIPYFYAIDKRWHRYFVDFKITYSNGDIKLIEVKPHKETMKPKGDKRTKRLIRESLVYVKNRSKWEYAEEFVKQRGWTFEIWTEKYLLAHGIMPKSTKPAKKLKPYRRRPKKK
jgi:hypothetical protein